MALTDIEKLDLLSARYGIVDDYYDIRGVHHIASAESKRRILAAMRVACANAAEVDASLEAHWRHDWQTVVAPVLVCREGEDAHDIVLTVDEQQFERPLHWRVDSESGESYLGSWEFDIEQCFDQVELDGVRRLRLRAALPVRTGPGYHRLSLELADGMIEVRLIVAPRTCYLPDAIAAGGRSWGVSLQLYALRSQRNWGIGDFTDLRTAIGALAPLGIDCIGLNPLHALFPHQPENASPYSPSSRDFINPLYLDVEAVADADVDAAALQRVNSCEFQARLKSLRASDRVDYSGVCRVKLEVLRLLFDRFRQELANHVSARGREFREFQASGGDALFNFALFEALQAYFHEQDNQLQTWQQWPEPYRNPHSATVAEWAATHQADIEFHQYLQWQAQLQLTAAREDCAGLGLRIGLYNDLAVGNSLYSAQCWAQAELYALGAGIGAPPDDFSPAGQNWGLPPQLPERMRAEAYLPFIRSLRTNMQHAGALRIDHVMALLRLYWVPAGIPADEGTYVTYPFDDLLGILALESHRNQCLVIGEDLGTVPDEIRHALWLNQILSYRILMFEKDWQAGSFKAPADYPELALCASGSHDLPTLRGYWRETDLELREKLRLYPDDTIAAQQRELRKRDRVQLLAALARENLLDSDDPEKDAAAQQLSEDLLLAVQAFLARSPACLMILQLEDLLGQVQQVNLPGTIEEYSNWRHKIPVELESWSEHGAIEHIAQTINRERARQSADTS